MERPDFTEDERNEVTVLAMLEILRVFGDPRKRPAKVIPWPKPQAKQERSRHQDGA
jgi:hypothetical protein